MDTVVTVTEEGYIKTNLYIKPGTKCTYLSPASCHPNHITKNIPYSLAYRLLRICSDPRDFSHHLRILRKKLVQRGYRPNVITAAFDKLKNTTRSQALLKVQRVDSKRPCLPIPYDPRFPAVSKILHKHWSVLTRDPRYKRMFPQPPMVSYSRCKNLKDFLVRAKVPTPSTSSRRNRPGFNRCLRGGTFCVMCSTSPNNVSSHTSAVTGETWPITSAVTCTTSNVLYRLRCTKQSGECRQYKDYIGQTSRRACDRVADHRSSVTNPGQRETKKVVGRHFRQPGHSWSCCETLVFEKCRSTDDFVRLRREQMWIRRYDCVQPRGINIRT